MRDKASKVEEARAETQLELSKDDCTDERCTKCGEPLEEGITAYIKGRRVCWRCLIQR
jgi:formylmethanofuran dehydrogenase subunit E